MAWKRTEEKHFMFKELNDKKEKEYRQWARDNFKPGMGIDYTLWHPIVVKECRKIIDEFTELSFPKGK